MNGFESRHKHEQRFSPHRSSEASETGLPKIRDIKMGDLKGFAHAADLLNFRILGFDPFSAFLCQKRVFGGPGLSPMDPDRNLEPYPGLHAPN